MRTHRGLDGQGGAPLALQAAPGQEAAGVALHSGGRQVALQQVAHRKAAEGGLDAHRRTLLQEARAGGVPARRCLDAHRSRALLQESAAGSKAAPGCLDAHSRCCCLLHLLAGAVAPPRRLNATGRFVLHQQLTCLAGAPGCLHRHRRAALLQELQARMRAPPCSLDAHGRILLHCQLPACRKATVVALKGQRRRPLPLEARSLLPAADCRLDGNRCVPLLQEAATLHRAAAQGLHTDCRPQLAARVPVVRVKDSTSVEGRMRRRAGSKGTPTVDKVMHGTLPPAYLLLSTCRLRASPASSMRGTTRWWNTSRRATLPR